MLARRVMSWAATAATTLLLIGWIAFMVALVVTAWVPRGPVVEPAVGQHSHLWTVAEP